MSEFDGMTALQIAEKIEAAKAALAFAQESEIAALKKEIEDRCAQLCIDPYDLFAPPVKPKAAPLYAGPNGETWSGRGKRPAWLVRELEGLSDEEAEEKLNSFKAM